MTAGDCAWILAIALAAFAVRAVPRLTRPHALDSDSYFHLCCARAIRENRLRLPARLPGVVLGHEYTYPFLYHWLLAALPESARLKLERVSSALLDALAVAAVGGFLLWQRDTDAWDMDPRTPLLATALFALAPALLRIGSGPRAYSGSPRPLGELLYLLHAMCAYHAFVTGSAWSAAASVLCAAAIFAASKFSVQALLFFAPAFALLVSPWYLALVAVAAVAAALLSGGKAWRVLVGHVRHSDFYVRHLQRIYLHPGSPTVAGYARAALASLREARARRSIAPIVDWYFREPHPLHLLATVFTPFLVLPFAAAENHPDAFRFLLVWSAAGFAWFVATRTRPLRFLGEGERYLEHALFPAVAVATDFVLRAQPAWVYAYLVYSALAAAHYVAAFRARHAASDARHDEATHAFAALHGMPPGVVLPIGSIHWRTLYHTRFPVLTIGGNVDLALLPLEEFMLVYGRYPYPSPDFSGVIEKFDVKYVVSDLPNLRHYAEVVLGSRQAFHDRVRALFDTPGLAIYQVMPGR